MQYARRWLTGRCAWDCKRYTRKWNKFKLNRQDQNRSKREPNEMQTRKNEYQLRRFHDTDNDRTQFVCVSVFFFAYFSIILPFAVDRLFISFFFFSLSLCRLYICLGLFARLLSIVPADTLGSADAPSLRINVVFSFEWQRNSIVKTAVNVVNEVSCVSLYPVSASLLLSGCHAFSNTVQFNTLRSIRKTNTFPYECESMPRVLRASTHSFERWLMMVVHAEPKYIKINEWICWSVRQNAADSIHLPSHQYLHTGRPLKCDGKCAKTAAATVSARKESAKS